MVPAAPKGAGQCAAGERIGEHRRIRDGQAEAQHAVDDATRRPPVRGHRDSQRRPGPVAVDHPGVAARQELLDDQRGADGIGVLLLPRTRPRAGKARGLGRDIRPGAISLTSAGSGVSSRQSLASAGRRPTATTSKTARTTSGRRASTARLAASMSPMGFSLCGRVPGARRTVTLGRGRWPRSIEYRCSSWGAVRWGWRWPWPWIVSGFARSSWSGRRRPRIIPNPAGAGCARWRSFASGASRTPSGPADSRTGPMSSR
jgi:hypothetical protein